MDTDAIEQDLFWQVLGSPPQLLDTDDALVPDLLALLSADTTLDNAAACDADTPQLSAPFLVRATSDHSTDGSAHMGGDCVRSSSSAAATAESKASAGADACAPVAAASCFFHHNAVVTTTHAALAPQLSAPVFGSCVLPPVVALPLVLTPHIGQQQLPIPCGDIKQPQQQQQQQQLCQPAASPSQSSDLTHISAGGAAADGSASPTASLAAAPIPAPASTGAKRKQQPAARAAPAAKAAKRRASAAAPSAAAAEDDSDVDTSSDDDEDDGGSEQQPLTKAQLAALRRRAPEVNWRAISDPAERRRQRRLAKNRVTAARSRERKKEQWAETAARLAALEQENAALRAQLRGLSEENAGLKARLASPYRGAGPADTPSAAPCGASRSYPEPAVLACLAIMHLVVLLAAPSGRAGCEGLGMIRRAGRAAAACSGRVLTSSGLARSRGSDGGGAAVAAKGGRAAAGGARFGCGHVRLRGGRQPLLAAAA
jgi:cyclic AMP-dependent transcription factor ATF-2